MFNLVYKSIVVECSTGVEDLAKAIEKKSEEMLNKGYKLVTMSMVGTNKAILVFKIQVTDKRGYEEKSVNKIFYDNDRRKTGMKSAFRLCFIYNSYKIACQERAGNPPVFLTFFIIPVSVPHT